MHIPIFIQVFCNFGLSMHTSSLSKAFMPHWSHQGIGFTSMTLRSRFLLLVFMEALQTASAPNFQGIVTSHYIVVVVPQPQRGIELSGYQTKNN